MDFADDRNSIGIFAGNPFPTTNSVQYDAYISELILHDREVTASERAQINSYLAFKYGTTLDQTVGTSYVASDDLTLMWDKDATDATGHNADIAVIGQDNISGILQSKSKSQDTDGVVTIGGATDIDNLEFLSWGNDDGTASWTTTGAPAGYQMLDRNWSVQETGDVGTVTIEFDVADGDFDIPAFNQGVRYFFVQDTDDDDTLDDETPIPLYDDGTNGDTVSSDDIWTATGIDLVDNGEFNIAGQSIAPGGVGTGVAIWLRGNDLDGNGNTTDNPADATNVTAWNDISGNLNNTDGTGHEPVYRDNTTDNVNYNQVVDFDGSSDYLVDSSGIFAASTYSDIHLYYVGRTDTQQANTLIYEIGSSAVNLYNLNNAWSDNTIRFDIGDSTGNGRLTYNPYTTVTQYGDVNQWTYLSSQTGGNEQRMRIDGSQFASSTQSTTMTGNNNALYVGSDGGTNYFDGDIAEIVTYTADHTAAEINRIESYLALKYGRTLDQISAQDYVASDATTEMWDKDTTDASTYDNDIAGIGRDNASGLLQITSKSSNDDGVVAIGSASDLEELEFLSWGNDNGTAIWTFTGAPLGYQILDRQWSVQENNGDVGMTKVEIDVTDTDFDIPVLVQGTNYFLVQDIDNDGDLTDETPITMYDDGTNGDTTSSDNVWTVQSIGFDSGEEFTIGTITDAVSGRVYIDEGTTNIGAGKTIRLYVNGVDSGLTDDTDSNGDYLITSVTISASDILTVYLDDETENGATITTSTGSTMFGLDIYQDYLITRSDNGGSLTSTDINTAHPGSDVGSETDDINTLYTKSGLPGTVDFNNVEVLIPATHGLNLSSSTSINFDGDVDIDGSLNVGSIDININGHWDYDNSTGTYTALNNELTFGGSFDQNFTHDAVFPTDIRVINNNKNVTLQSNLNLSNNDLDIVDAGFDLNGYNLAMSGGTFDVDSDTDGDGKFRLQGGETVTLGGGTVQDTNSGLWEYYGNGTGVQSLLLIKNWGATDYYDLQINDTSATNSDTFYINTAMRMANDLTVTDATYSGETFANYVNGDVLIEANGTLIGTSNNLYLLGNWTNNGSFVHNNGEVVFNSTSHTVSGNTTWHDVTLEDLVDDSTSETLTLEAGTVQTITGLLNLDGFNGDDRVVVVSDTPSTQATFDFTVNSTFSGDFLDVTDNIALDNSTGVTVPLGPPDTISSGGNTVGWFYTVSLTAHVDGAEPSTGIQYTTSLDSTNNTGSTITVNYTYSGGTATGGAGAGGGTDYNNTTTSVGILNGQQNATINVPVFDDNVIEGNESVEITIQSATGPTVVATGGTETRTANIIEDDAAGVTLTITDSQTDELGDTATVRFELDSIPTNDVTIPLSIDDGTEGTIGATTDITITPANWNIPANNEITITGLDDPVNDGDIGYNLVTGDPTSLDGDYDALNAVSVADAALTNIDDDIPGITVSVVDSVSDEDGDGARIQFELNTLPSNDVTIPLSVDDGTEGAVAASIVITPANWNVPANNEVTITGQDDVIIDGAIGYNLITGDPTSLDGDYDILDASDVADAALTNNDNDSAGANVTAISGDTDETGTTATFQVTLDSMPTDDVTIALSSDDTGEGTVPASITITPANWNTGAANEVIVTGVDDVMIDGTQGFNIVTGNVTSLDLDYNPLDGTTIGDIAVNNTDDDSAGITVTIPDAVSDELGDTAAVRFELTSMPTNDVVIPLSVDDGTEGSVPVSITINPANWNQPANNEVLVTGVNDVIIDGNIGYNLITGDPTSLDGNYDALNAASVTDPALTNNDNDVANVSVVNIDNLTDEDGDTGIVRFSLSSMPTDDVTIPLSISDGTEATIGAVTDITITPANWNQPLNNEVTVTGLADDLIDGNVPYSLITGDPTSLDPNYDALTAVSVPDGTLSNDDTDVAGVIINVSDGVSDEDGDTAAVRFSLNNIPTNDVTIPLSVSDATEGDLGATTDITITPANWNVPANNEVTITGVDDLLIDGNVIYQLVTGDPTSLDSNYDALTAANVADPSFTNNDNDTPGVSINITDAVSDETGDTATVEILLDSIPANDVTIPLAVSDGTEGTLGATSSITITPANWNNGPANTVTITGVDDVIIDGDIGFNLITGDPTSVDPNYDVLDASDTPDASLTNNDDDVAGVTVTPIDIITDETGDTATVQFELDSMPSNDVVIPVSVTDTTEASLGAVTDITITPVNWNIPANNTLTIFGLNDVVIDGNIAFTMVTGDPTSSDGDYDALNAASVADVGVTNNDDDVAGIVVNAVDSTTDENGATATVQFSLGSMPSNDVTIPLSIDDGTEGTIGATTDITIAPANWNQPLSNQIVVTGLDDIIIDGNIGYNLVTGDPTSLDGDYDALTAIGTADAALTNADNDSAGVTVSVIDGVTDEAGDTATVRFQLNSQPSGDVTIPLSLSDLTEGTLGAVTDIVITPANWNMPANNEVIVTGLDDVIIDGNVTYQLITGDPTSPDSDYNGLNAASVIDPTLTNNDDDSAGVSINILDTNTDEAGDIGIVQFSLTSQPSSPVTIPLSVDDVTEGSVASSIVIDPLDWNIPTNNQLTVAGIDDVIIDGSVGFNLVTGDPTSPDSNYNSLNAGDVADVGMINADNDTAGIIVNAIDATTDESGDTALIQFSMTSMPSANIGIPLSVSDGSEGSVPVTATISPANWNSPANNQILVTGVDDFIIDGNVAFTMITGDPTSSDPNYDALNAGDVNDIGITNNDNDVAGVNVSVVDGVTTEAAGTATIEFTLDSQPTADVTIPVSIDDLTEGTLGATTNIVILLANWNTPTNNQIMVTGVDDLAADGNVNYNLVTGDPTSGDPNYDALTSVSVADASLINLDDDGIDSDGDGVTDVQEGIDGTDAANPKSFKDSDNDGVPDAVELTVGSNPNNSSSYQDSDSGGTPNYVESILFPIYGLPATGSGNSSDDGRDTDGDGISDYQEILNGTNPLVHNNPPPPPPPPAPPAPPEPEVVDTDADGVPDEIETEQGTDPQDPEDYLDTDGDEVPNYIEELENTDINDAADYLDSDSDQVPDYVEEFLEETDSLDVESYLDLNLNQIADYAERQGLWTPDADTMQQFVTENVVDGKIYTNETTPVIVGTGEPGNKVEIVNDIATVLCETSISAVGNWECEFNFALADGEYPIVISEYDAQGLPISEREVILVVDTVAPASPVAAEIVNSIRPIFSGSGTEVGATISVVLNRSGTQSVLGIDSNSSNVLCTALVQADLTWSCESRSEFAAGELLLVDIFQTDLAGNDSQPTRTEFGIENELPILVISGIILTGTVLLLSVGLVIRRKRRADLSTEQQVELPTAQSEVVPLQPIVPQSAQPQQSIDSPASGNES